MITTKRPLAIAGSLALAVILAMSVPAEAQSKRTKNTVGGAAVGAGVGYLVGGSDGAKAGAVVGAISGYRKKR